MNQLYLNLTYTSYNSKIIEYKEYQSKFLELAKNEYEEIAYSLDNDTISEIYKETLKKFDGSNNREEKRTLEKLSNSSPLCLNLKSKNILMIVMEQNMIDFFSLLEKLNKMQTTSLSVRLLYVQSKDKFELKVIDDNLKVEELLSKSFPDSFSEKENYVVLVMFFLAIVNFIDVVVNNPFTSKKSNSSDIPKNID